MVQYMDNKSSGFNAWAAARDNKKKTSMSSLLVWVAIFFMAWWLMSSWLSPKKVDNAPAAATFTEQAAPDISKVPVQTIDNEKINAKVQGLRVSDISLKQYKADTKNAESGPVELLSSDGEFMEIGLLANGTAAPAVDTLWKVSRGLSAENTPMQWRNADGVEFTRTISSDNYVMTIRDEIKNNSNRDMSFSPYARVVKSTIEKSQTGVAAGGVAFIDSKIKRENWQSLSKKSYAYQTNSGFTGFETQYWQVVVKSGGTDQTIRMRQRVDGMYQADAAAGAVHLNAGKTADIETKIYAGPKTADDLKAAAVAIPGINQTIDYGWFWFLAQPFLWVLNALFAFVGNYGIAIILLTIMLRILMWPLTRKSYTSMAAMQKMQPELQRIQKMYANDKARLQQEMMKVYRTHKTSPMSGCMPMLLQIPIFFALYKALLISVPMRGAAFLWIPDLSMADPTSIFNLFGLLPYSLPSWLMIGILPILMGATMWVQQYLQGQGSSKKSADAANPVAQSMKFMKWMPFIFVFMFAWMPAGLVLYWTVSNIFGIFQTWLIKKTMK